MTLRCPAVLNRRDASSQLEGPAERKFRPITDARRNLGESQVGVLKQLCCDTHAPARQIAMWRLTHRGTENASECSARQTSFLGEFLEFQRPVGCPGHA